MILVSHIRWVSAEVTVFKCIIPSMFPTLGASDTKREFLLYSLWKIFIWVDQLLSVIITSDLTSDAFFTRTFVLIYTIFPFCKDNFLNLTPNIFRLINCQFARVSAKKTEAVTTLRWIVKFKCSVPNTSSIKCDRHLVSTKAYANSFTDHSQVRKYVFLMHVYEWFIQR